MTKCECYAILSENDERAEIWKQVCSDLRLPLKHPLPVLAKNNDGEELRFYEGDPERLDDFQKARISELMAEKFDLDEKAVFESLKKGIMPIRADNVTVMICNLHLRCMM